MGYFVPNIHCFEFFRGCLSTGVLGGALFQLQEPNSPYPIGCFRSLGVSETQAYIPGVRYDDGEGGISFALPINSGIAVGAFSNYHQLTAFIPAL